MTAIGEILLVLGCIISLVGNVMFLNVAFRRSYFWFFGCLFVPLMTEAFLLSHLKASFKSYSIFAAGLGIAFLGAILL